MAPGIGPVDVRRAKMRDRGEGGCRGENPRHLIGPAEMDAADRRVLDALLLRKTSSVAFRKPSALSRWPRGSPLADRQEIRF